MRRSVDRGIRSHNVTRGSVGSSARSVVFFSTMDGSPWGGSEELWARTALILAKEGMRVAASVHGWSPPHDRIVKLTEAGVDVRLRRSKQRLWRRVWEKAFSRDKGSVDTEIVKFLDARSPHLVVVCN